MISKLLKLVVLAAVVALALGAYVGTRLPFGDAHLKTVEVTATVGAGGVVTAESDGDERFTFHRAAVAWADGTRQGEGAPPCLRTIGARADLEIGHTAVSLPDGRTQNDVVLWVRCR